VGVARVVTGFATFACLGGVFVLESQRGRGLCKWMMDCILAHPSLQGLRRWLQAANHVHGLYRQLGFSPIASPEA
jgi:predicted GNAT family N-acyltransferase